MKSSSFVSSSVFVLILFTLSVSLFAQVPKPDTVFIPKVGQAGKDVIWVPTPDDLVKKMLEVSGVTPKDFLIDLGSGDGRTVIAAAKIGARALGIEYNPEMVELSLKKAAEARVGDKAQFRKADLFETDLSEATVITMFLLPDINLKLRPKLLDLKPGTRIVSNTFTMGEWTADTEVSTEENYDSWTTALMWIVPSKIEGRWKLGKGELTINQKFQFFSGTYSLDDKVSTIKDGRLNGDTISFHIDDKTYTGIVRGKSATGSATTSSSKEDWLATRLN